MKTFILALLLASGLHANDSFSGFCEQGARTVVTAGQNGAPKVQGSYPQCTVTVYLSGTLTLASIFSDDAGTAKGNPFTATTNGYWTFYAADARYDVTFSSGGLPSPWTLGGKILYDPFAYLFPATGAVKRSVSSKLNEVASVKDFGAKGDNSTDDTAAFQAAIDWCQKGVCAVYAPAGTYIISSTLNLYAGTYLYGAWYRPSVLKPVGAITCLSLLSTGGSFETAVLDVKVSGLTILGESNASSKGVLIQGTDLGMAGYAYTYHITLEDMIIQNMGVGVHMGFAFDVTLRNVHVTSSEGDNIRLESPVVDPAHSVQTTIRFEHVYSELAGQGGTGMALDNLTNSSNFASYSSVYQNSVSSIGSPGTEVRVGGFQSSVWVDTYTESDGTSAAFDLQNSQSVTVIGGRFALHKYVFTSAGNAINVTLIGITSNSTQTKVINTSGTNKNWTIIAPTFDMANAINFGTGNYQVIGGTDQASGQGYNVLNHGTAAQNHYDNIGVGTMALTTGTYVSGGTISGSTSQTCTLSAFNGGGTGATATVALTSSNTVAGGSDLVMTALGSGYTTPPTSATLGSGTATCSGTVLVSVSIGNPLDLHFDGTITSLSQQSYFGPAVRHLAIGNLGSGSGVWIDAEGTDTDIFMNFRTKGVGQFLFQNGQVSAPSLIQTAPCNSSTCTPAKISVPANSSVSCVANTYAQDTTFLYLCVATNTWRRVAISSF